MYSSNNSHHSHSRPPPPPHSLSTFPPQRDPNAKVQTRNLYHHHVFFWYHPACCHLFSWCFSLVWWIFFATIFFWNVGVCLRWSTFFWKLDVVCWPLTTRRTKKRKRKTKRKTKTKTKTTSFDACWTVWHCFCHGFHDVHDCFSSIELVVH